MIAEKFDIIKLFTVYLQHITKQLFTLKRKYDVKL